MKSTSKKTIAAAVVILVFLGLWYAFRPEKLFLNKQVSEAPPVGDTLMPIYTGRFDGAAHKTTGRATVYRSADGVSLLKFTDFATSDASLLHVLLVDVRDPAAQNQFHVSSATSVDLGALEGSRGDQSYRVPKGVDLQRFHVVTICCDLSHTYVGVASLQDF